MARYNQAKAVQMIRLITLILSAVLLLACGTIEEKISTEQHLPSGILTSSHKPVDKNTLLTTLQQSDYIILGETHDNPTHHALQADIINAFIDAGKRPTIVLEMLDTNEQEKIHNYNKSDKTTAIAFDQMTGFSKKGWGFKGYLPLLEILATKQLPVIAGNLPRQYSRPLIKEGLASAPEFIQRTLKAFTLTQQQKQALEEMIVRGHCNALPETMIPGMFNVQLARDAALATAVLQSKKPVILITGSGHARKSTAVPAYLTAIDPSAKITSLSFIENDTPNIKEAIKDFDYAWLTEPVKRDDPCIAFKKSRNNSSD